MSTKRYSILFLLSTLLILHNIQFSIASNPKIESDLNVNTNHIPISIIGNLQLSNMGLPGSGTSEDPYVLSNRTIDGTGFPNAFSLIGVEFVTSWLIIANNTLTNANLWGIYIFESSNIIINDNFIENMGSDGIGVAESIKIEVINNTITNTGFGGVRLEIASHNVVVNNTISQTQESGVTLLNDANSNLVKGNTISNASGGVSLHWDDENEKKGGSHNIIQENYMVNITYNGIFGKGIAVNNSFIGNEILNADVGISLEETDGFVFANMTIEGNIVHDCSNGMIINGASNFIIKENIVFNIERQGIWMGNSLNLTIENNLVYLNGPDSGINLYYTHNSIVKGNIMHDSPDGGLLLEYSNENAITFNFIFNAVGRGIELWRSDYNVVQYNNFRNNVNNLDNAGRGNIIGYNYYDKLPYTYDLTKSETTNYAVIKAIEIINEEISGSDYYNLFWGSDVQDNPFFEFTYNVSYSVDLKESWVSVANNLTSNSYTVNVTQIEPYNFIFFKIDIMDNYNFTSNFIDYPDDLLANRVVSSPILKEPSVNTELSGTVTISWAESQDTLDLPFTYRAEILHQGSNVWEILVDETSETTYSWDTTAVENGQYLIKIVSVDLLGFEVQYVSPGLFTIENQIIESTTTDDPTSENDPSFVGFTPLYIFLPSFIMVIILRRK